MPLAILADDIGKFPDNTVAAALQRIPGIQVVNRFNNEITSPLIRGIGDIPHDIRVDDQFYGASVRASF